jgi:hypothetical protein
MTMKPFRLLAATAALLAGAAVVPSPLRAQGVLVAPQGIVIDHRTRSGSFELYNPGTEAAEVTVSTLYGYPVSDSAGRTTLATFASPDSTQPSAAAWVQAYPRRLTMRPGERQTVRLFAKPPANLRDGEYWTRLVVTAKGAPLAASGLGDTTALKAGLTLEVRTVVAAWYRKGPVQTALQLSGVKAGLMRGGDSVEVRMRFQRQGNAAYIGTARGSLVDAAGKEVGAFTSQLAVYHTLEPRYTIPVAALAPGRYTLRVQADVEREDLARTAVVKGNVVKESVDIVIPPRAGR